MKNNLFVGLIIFGIGFLSCADLYACPSNCKPCSDGFQYTSKCCNYETNDCVLVKDEIEKCGVGQWQEYPLSFDVASGACCKDETEGYCVYIRSQDHCGTGKFKKLPYSPIKQCCKDATKKDCVTIRAKGYCGEYQLEKYPVREGICCNADYSECVKANSCPKRCI